MCLFVYVHTACARLKGAMSSRPDLQVRCLKPLSYPPPFFLFCFLLSSLFVHRQHGGPDQGGNQRGQGKGDGEEGEIMKIINAHAHNNSMPYNHNHIYMSTQKLTSYYYKIKSYIVKANISPSHP